MCLHWYARAAQLIAPEQPQPTTPPSAAKTGDGSSHPSRNVTKPALPDLDAVLVPDGDDDEDILLVESDGEEEGGGQLQLGRQPDQAGLGSNSLALQEGDTLFGLDSQLDRRELAPNEAPAAVMVRMWCLN